jgi:hypothetical protein
VLSERRFNVRARVRKTTKLCKCVQAPSDDLEILIVLKDEPVDQRLKSVDCFRGEKPGDLPVMQSTWFELVTMFMTRVRL